MSKFDFTGLPPQLWEQVSTFTDNRTLARLALTSRSVNEHVGPEIVRRTTFANMVANAAKLGDQTPARTITAIEKRLTPEAVGKLTNADLYAYTNLDWPKKAHVEAEINRRYAQVDWNDPVLVSNRVLTGDKIGSLVNADSKILHFPEGDALGTKYYEHIRDVMYGQDRRPAILVRANAQGRNIRPVRHTKLLRHGGPSLQEIVWTDPELWAVSCVDRPDLMAMLEELWRQARN